MTESTEAAPAALLGHCTSVYNEMTVQAHVVTAENVQLLVYEGKLTELVTVHVGLSVPYYTKVTQALKGMGCAKQLRRGGGNSPSQWQLIRPPSLGLYLKWQDLLEAATEDEPEYATAQAVRDMNTRVQRIEKAMGI